MKKLLCLLIAAATMSLSPADVIDVYVFHFEFTTDPTHATVVDPVINIGDTIRWIFDDLGHNAKSVSGSVEAFNSGFPTEVGSTFEHTFTTLGTHWYFCEPHGFDLENGTAEGMAATVTVVPEPATIAILGLGVLAAARRKLKH